MLWNSEKGVNIISFNSYHIDAKVETEDGKQMRSTGVYGHPEMSQKKHTGTLLRRLVGLSCSPWVCFGNFNEILHLDEKNGQNDRDVYMISEFRDAIQVCNLKDLGFTGHPFTWSNMRFGPPFIEE